MKRRQTGALLVLVLLASVLSCCFGSEDGIALPTQPGVQARETARLLLGRRGLLQINGELARTPSPTPSPNLSVANGVPTPSPTPSPTPAPTQSPAANPNPTASPTLTNGLRAAAPAPSEPPKGCKFVENDRQRVTCYVNSCGGSCKAKIAVGVIFGILGFIGLILVILWCCCWRKRRARFSQFAYGSGTPGNVAMGPLYSGGAGLAPAPVVKGGGGFEVGDEVCFRQANLLRPTVDGIIKDVLPGGKYVVQSDDLPPCAVAEADMAPLLRPGQKLLYTDAQSTMPATLIQMDGNDWPPFYIVRCDDGTRRDATLKNVGRLR